MNVKMKNTFFFALFSMAFLSCEKDGKDGQDVVEEIQAEGKISSIIRSPITAHGMDDTVNVAKLVFEETEYDFGEVTEGDEVEHVFKFKNTGKVPLIIDNANSSCGCTVPEWPKGAISPDEGGEIHVRFNTTNKPNNQEKTVKITANTYPSETRLMLKGFVHPKD